MAEHVMTSEEATKLLADCYRMTGADCDGNEDWRIAPRALRAVTDLRRDYGEAHELFDRQAQRILDLVAQNAELEQQMQGLRARLARLESPTPEMLLCLIDGEAGPWGAGLSAEFYGTREHLEQNYAAMVSLVRGEGE